MNALALDNSPAGRAARFGGYVARLAAEGREDFAAAAAQIAARAGRLALSARVLTAGSCFFCHQDRPLTKGVCDQCAPQPVAKPRWLIRYDDVASYVVKPETRDLIVRLHPHATVTDLAVVWCDACQGVCTDRCDAGAGTWPERQEAERRGITVSDLRNDAVSA